jgi:hypothetical protein
MEFDRSSRTRGSIDSSHERNDNDSGVDIDSSGEGVIVAEISPLPFTSGWYIETVEYQNITPESVS